MSDEQEVAAQEPRVQYKVDIKDQQLTVSKGAESIELPMIFPDDVTKHLAQLGLIKYLHQETTKKPNEDKLLVIEQAYDDLAERGMDALQKKPVNRGPKKADRIAALAAIKGVTPDQIKDAMKGMPAEKEQRILNHPAVLQKVEELQSNEDQLDLEL